MSAERFGAAAVRTCDPWGRGAVTVVRPADRAMLKEVLAVARSEQLRVLPLGRGTKLGKQLPPERLDLLIDMGGFDRVIAFEPGDGTLTAECGVAFDELSQLCRGGARAIVPELLPGASLGGAIATAETGADRLWRGPIREHVLGLEVMLADGTTSRSGGRLVKNVAGYDLHRLHTGGFGGLGFLLEATLRLFPAPECEQHLVSVVGSPAEAAESAAALRAARLPAKRIWCHTTAKESLFFVSLAGREDVVSAAAAAARRLLPSLSPTEEIPSEQRPGLILHGPPSAATKLAAYTSTLRAQLDADATVSIDPLLARSAFAFEALGPLELADRIEPLVVQMQTDGIHTALPRLSASLPSNARALIRGLELTLDPTEMLAR